MGISTERAIGCISFHCYPRRVNNERQNQITIDLDPDQENADLVTGHELSRDNWEDLKVIFDSLFPLCTRSLQLQRNATNSTRPNGFIADAIRAMDELLGHLD
jgi:hypothetical protein